MQKVNNEETHNLESIHKYDENYKAEDVRDILMNAFVDFINSKEVLFK